MNLCVLCLLPTRHLPKLLEEIKCTWLWLSHSGKSFSLRDVRIRPKSVGCRTKTREPFDLPRLTRDKYFFLWKIVGWEMTGTNSSRSKILCKRHDTTHMYVWLLVFGWLGSGRFRLKCEPTILISGPDTRPSRGHVHIVNEVAVCVKDMLETAKWMGDQNTTYDVQCAGSHLIVRVLKRMFRLSTRVLVAFLGPDSRINEILVLGVKVN